MSGLELGWVWLAAVGAAFAGSPHCAGMCGPFVLSCAAGGRGAVRSSPVFYLAGKTTTYLTLGALAGWGGQSLARLGRPSTIALGILAAVSFGGLGLHQLGFRPRIRVPLSANVRGAFAAAFRGVDALPFGIRSVGIGALSGLLPCPLVAAFLLAAGASGSVVHALVIASGLALGTAPALLAVAWIHGWISARARTRWLGLSGAFLLALAAYTAYRTIAEPPCCELAPPPPTSLGSAN